MDILAHPLGPAAADDDNTASVAGELSEGSEGGGLDALVASLTGEIKAMRGELNKTIKSGEIESTFPSPERALSAVSNLAGNWKRELEIQRTTASDLRDKLAKVLGKPL
jgi:hypothetical protein